MKMNEIGIMMGYRKSLEKFFPPFNHQKRVELKDVSKYNKTPKRSYSTGLCEVPISATLANVLNAMNNNPQDQQGFCSYKLSVRKKMLDYETVYVGEYSYYNEECKVQITNIALYNNSTQKLFCGYYDHDDRYKDYGVFSESFLFDGNSHSLKNFYPIVLALIANSEDIDFGDEEFKQYLHQFKQYSITKDEHSINKVFALDALGILSENLYYRIKDSFIEIEFTEKLSDVIYDDKLTNIENYAVDLREDRFVITGDPDSQNSFIESIKTKFEGYPIWNTNQGTILRYNRGIIQAKMEPYLCLKHTYSDDIIICKFSKNMLNKEKTLAIYSNGKFLGSITIKDRKLISFNGDIDYIPQIEENMLDDDFAQAITMM